MIALRCLSCRGSTIRTTVFGAWESREHVGERHLRFLIDK